MQNKYAYVFASDENQLDLTDNLKSQLNSKTKIDWHYFPSKNGWFDKPIHILNMLRDYEKVCWLDNDIEIIQNFDEIFTISEKEINGVPDYLYPLCLNTGVLVVNQNAYGLLSMWAGMASLAVTRSDQEALQQLRQHNSNFFGELPLKYNHQKWAIKNGVLPSPDTAIVHWTGDDGKATLRERINSQKTAQ